MGLFRIFYVCGFPSPSDQRKRPIGQLRRKEFWAGMAGWVCFAFFTFAGFPTPATKPSTAAPSRSEAHADSDRANAATASLRTTLSPSGRCEPE